MQDSKVGSLRHKIASRLNAHSQTDWAIEDQAKTYQFYDAAAPAAAAAAGNDNDL